MKWLHIEFPSYVTRVRLLAYDGIFRGCRNCCNGTRLKLFVHQSALRLTLYVCFVVLICSGVIQASGQSPQSPSLLIKGRVIDVNGDGVKEAELTLNRLTSGSAVTRRADTDGSFIFSGLSAGRYQISVKKAGFVTISQQVTLGAEQEYNVTISLTLASIRDSVSVFDHASPYGDGKADFNGVARMNEVVDQAVYAGKKNEILILANLNANLATGTTRQVFAKVPGTNIWENDGSGLQIGVSNRGLDPNRSWEMNSRQNGYDITADIFGYPEAYFTPPLEAVERIEVVRSASSLQYGAQFGGLVNYVLKEAPRDRRFTFTTEQTGGANGLYNSHTRTGGTIGNLAYNAYYQHRQADGWRKNSGYDSNTGFGSLGYEVNDRWRIRFEFTGMEYLLQMAGGLTEELFKQNPRASLRPRNWFKLKWLVPALKIEHNIDPKTRISFSAFGLRGTRHSLFNSSPVVFPDGSLNLDDPSAPRTLFQDRFRNHGIEARFLKNYTWLGRGNTLAVGARYSNGKTVRQHGSGFPGLEPEFGFFVPDVLRNLHFRNLNLAGFAENIFRLNSRLSITPGFRFDHIDSTAQGAPIVGKRERSRAIPLLGVGISYRLSEETNLYANVSQAYRATLFNDYWRPDLSIVVDQNAKDMTGYVSEFGWRGRYNNWLNFDVSGFYLKYRNRLGLLTRQNPAAQTISLWTNISDSRNIGFESFVEADLLRMAVGDDSKGALSLFTSIAKINTRYLGGSVRANRVEFAPESIIRAGLTYRLKGFSTTMQYSSVGDQFTDASNTVFTVDGVQGLIPAYQLWDLSGSYNFRRYVIRGGINNLADKHYFNRRGTSYPGPGLIPADGRSFYVSAGFRY